MNNAYFRVIIPNYNNKDYLERCLDSVFNQTFKDVFVIVSDDVSTDGSVEFLYNYAETKAPRTDDGHPKMNILAHVDKQWNGGARNSALSYCQDSKYTLFLDSDDCFTDNDCIQTIYDMIQENNEPDCVRLSYNCVIGENTYPQIMDQTTPEQLVQSCVVACWTKCIKTNLIQPFPENTLMEDVVQHIKQCDVINTMVLCTKPIVDWNRNNTNSCSREENQNLQQGKWQSSMYRYAADLMETTCVHDYCEAHRQWRLGIALNNIKEGKFIQ